MSNERYHGWQSTSQHPNVGDLYSGWFSTGFCNSNVEASVNGCSYENGVHGIATMSKGRTVVNNTTLARNNAKEANTEQCGQKGNGGGIFSMEERLYGIAERFVRIRQIGEVPFI